MDREDVLYTHTHTHTQTHRHTHTYTHTHTPTHIHTYTHTHTYTHIPRWWQGPSAGSLHRTDCKHFWERKLHCSCSWGPLTEYHFPIPTPKDHLGETRAWSATAKEKKMICYNQVWKPLLLDFDCTTASCGGPSNVQASDQMEFPGVQPERPHPSLKSRTKLEGDGNLQPRWTKKSSLLFKTKHGETALSERDSGKTWKWGGSLGWGEGQCLIFGRKGQTTACAQKTLQNQTRKNPVIPLGVMGKFRGFSFVIPTLLFCWQF